MPIIREVLDTLGIPIVGAAEHEADDVIGTLATRATLPIDIVTGDRDLFQLVDDSRDVRVDLHRARHEQPRDRHRRRRRREVRRAARASTPTSPPCAATPPTASPASPASARRPPPALLAAHGDLAGILAAAEAGDGMSAGVRAKLLAGLPYLAVAPRGRRGRARPRPRPTSTRCCVRSTSRRRRMPRPSPSAGRWAPR